jgi:hypothetical protein
MNYLKAFWHEVVLGHRPIAVKADTGGGVFIFCYECFNSHKDRKPLGYFQFAHKDSKVAKEGRQ